jgi:hypothetical protein
LAVGARDARSITAVSHNDVWVVGGVGVRPLSAHWDGRRWRVINHRREGDLYDVDASERNDVWAVGARGLSPEHGSLEDVYPLALHWDGHRWSEQSGWPNGEPTSTFDGVEAVSRTEAWITSDKWTFENGGVQRWDGRRWNHVLRGFTQGSVRDIAAVSERDVWVVGGKWISSGHYSPVLVHWNGDSWHIYRPRLGGGLNAVSAVSTAEVWAAGDHVLARYSCR